MNLPDPNIGDIVTFAGAKYPVQETFRDTNKDGEMLVYVIINRTTKHNGFTVPLTATKEYGPEVFQELTKAQAAEQKRLAALANAREIARRRSEREAARDAKPQKFRFKMP